MLVRLSIGDLVGQKVTVKNVPWTPDRDPMEQIRKDWSYSEPDPVHPLNNITVMTFLGIPYAEPPVSQRRFKVKCTFNYCANLFAFVVLSNFVITSRSIGLNLYMINS